MYTHIQTRTFSNTYLNSSVPTHNLKFYGLSIQLNGPDLEVHTNSANVALCVGVILSETNTCTRTGLGGRYNA